MNNFSILMPIRSEYGLHSGYIATMDMVKFLPVSKPPPNEREWAADRFEVSGRTNSGRETITP